MDSRHKRLGAIIAFAALVVILVLVTSPGGDDGGAGDGAEQPSGDLATKPTIEPLADLPSDLQVTDIVEGDGEAAKSGDILVVQYVGVDSTSAKEFDSSWEGGEPFPFPLGDGKVIAGWDQGMVGMKVGGRRELVIPPDLAYGEAGSGPIKPNATLTFVIDLLEIR